MMKNLYLVVEKMRKELGDEMLTVAMEELAELIQAVSKLKRGKPNMDNLAEEMADVIICLEVIKEISGVQEEEIEKWKDFKLERALVRIEEGNFK